MPTISRFEDLEIWKLARQQANEIYLLYSKGDFAKDFELKNQINAASGSVMDNISEGFERAGYKEFINFLLIAKGSNGEVKSQLYRALDRGYIDNEKFNLLTERNVLITKKTIAFIKYLKTTENKGLRYH